MREQAGKLVEEVRDLDGLLSADDARFSPGLDRSWQRVQALSERTAEYVSTGWEGLRAKSPGKDLIEAKLFLAYGRIDSLVAKDEAAAKVDLAEAEGYLKAAADKLTPETKPELDAIAARIKGLDKALTDKSGKHPDTTAFEGVETGLSVLIRHPWVLGSHRPVLRHCGPAGPIRSPEQGQANAQETAAENLPRRWVEQPDRTPWQDQWTRR